MAQKSILPQTFTSPSSGQMNWEEALKKMLWFMGTDKRASYEVIVGTDSEAVNGTADFVSALIVHKKGKGGVYFWGRVKIPNLNSMRQRIWQEALISLQLAEKLVEDFISVGFFDNNSKTNSQDNGINLEIHVDVGPNGETRQMINEIVGMIRANGFKARTKPESWGASHVADRHV